MASARTDRQGRVERRTPRWVPPRHPSPQAMPPARTPRTRSAPERSDGLTPHVDRHSPEPPAATRTTQRRRGSDTKETPVRKVRKQGGHEDGTATIPPHGPPPPDAERGGAVDRDRQGGIQRPECPRTSVLNQRIGEIRSTAHTQHRAGPGVWRAYADRPTVRGRLDPQNHAGSGVWQWTFTGSQLDRAGHPRWRGRRSRRAAEHRRARGHPSGTVLRLTHQTLVRGVRGVMVAFAVINP